MTELNRRKVLMASGTAVTVGLAGCIGGGGGDSDGNGNNTGDGNGGDATPEEQADTYLSDNNAIGYEGTDSIVDETGSDSVTIMVGGEQNAFDPVAVRITTGTEVTWEWVSGSHNVKVNEGPTQFENDEGVVSEEGHTYSRTIEQAGAYRYQCDPHAAQGMHGALIVEE